MPPYLPPRGVWTPTAIAYDKEISAAALNTWIKLKGLAWENGSTPEITMNDIQQITGKGHSVIYGHMTLLRAKGALRWRSIENGKLVVSFDTDDVYSEKPEWYSEKPEYADYHNPNTSLSIDSSIPPKDNTLTQEGIKVGVNGAGHSEKPESIPKNRNSRSDPRSKSPAILCAKSITGRYPPKAIYEDVIQVFGEQPDSLKAARCYKEWVSRGYNQNSYKWLLEWYVLGIPERNGSKPTPRKGYNPEVYDKLRKEKANANGN
jgi:hypothetical protein